ncbi:MAG: DMT family transporter [Candidatus Baltobacteraceae bacterium]
MAIALGLFAAAFYGAADFCGGFATRRSSMFAVAILSQAVGFAILLVIIPFFPGHAGRIDYFWGLLAGVCGGLGLALLYHALSIGKMGVVSPITAVLAASLPVFVGVVRGEHLSPAQMLGIGVALAAVVLISISTEDEGKIEFASAGVREAILSGLVLGGFYLFLAQAGPHAGLYPLIAARLGSIGFLLLVAVLLHQSVRPARGAVRLIAVAGSLDMTANALYVLATFAGYLSIAAVLTSLYPASTVLLARVVLKERLQPIQWLGVALALVGVGLIAL